MSDVLAPGSRLVGHIADFGWAMHVYPPRWNKGMDDPEWVVSVASPQAVRAQGRGATFDTACMSALDKLEARADA